MKTTFATFLMLLMLQIVPRACLADVAMFDFSLPRDSHNINPTYTVGTITLTCSTDSSATPFDGVGDSVGVAQTIGGYSYDATGGGLAGSLRLSENGVGRSYASAWLTFSTDVYQLRFWAWNASGPTTPFTFEAYDAQGHFVAATATTQVTSPTAPVYEFLSIVGNAPIRRLRIYGAINDVMLDNLMVWTEGVSAVSRQTWGELKARYRGR
jgi:hypothetical protein